MPRKLWSRFSRNDDVIDRERERGDREHQSPRIRSAGSPMITDAIAPTAPAARKAQSVPQLPVHVGRARGGGADGDERDLAEADLTCPAGEEHERDRDDRVDDHGRREVGVLVVEHERQRDQRTRRPRGAGSRSAHLHLGQPDELAGDRPHVRRVLPARHGLVFDA